MATIQRFTQSSGKYENKHYLIEYTQSSIQVFRKDGNIRSFIGFVPYREEKLASIVELFHYGVPDYPDPTDEAIMRGWERELMALRAEMPLIGNEKAHRRG